MIARQHAESESKTFQHNVSTPLRPSSLPKICLPAYSKAIPASPTATPSMLCITILGAAPVKVDTGAAVVGLGTKSDVLVVHPVLTGAGGAEAGGGMVVTTTVVEGLAGG